MKPFQVVVSDDSSDKAITLENKAVVQKYPGTRYVQGPCKGVCANRNNALSYAKEADVVSFVDDDVCIESDFIELAINRYKSCSNEDLMPILSGMHYGQKSSQIVPLRLSFRGYFCPSDKPETVTIISGAVFPRSLLSLERWDENIFFGYEDAELCLRAIKRGYKIVHAPELKIVDIGNNCSSLNEEDYSGKLTKYELLIEASRLYVGVKRYRYINSDFFKLFVFLGIFFTHLSVYLIRRQSLQAFPRIIRCSNLAWSKFGPLINLPA